MTKTENDGNSKEIANLLNFNSTLNIYWLNDIARLQAAILDEMQKQSDSRLKKELIWAKYSLGFLFNELENDYLKNGFRAEEHPFMYHGTAKTIYNIPEKIEKECITRNGRASIALSLECILNLADWPLIDPTKLATVLHQQASIRAILITLDDESANKAIADINVIINGLKGNPHMSIASEILNSIITHRNQDKYIPQILSFSL